MTEKMNKKSQVTIFVLAGIVILIGVSFLAGLEKEECRACEQEQCPGVDEEQGPAFQQEQCRVF